MITKKEQLIEYYQELLERNNLSEIERKELKELIRKLENGNK